MDMLPGLFRLRDTRNCDNEAIKFVELPFELNGVAQCATALEHPRSDHAHVRQIRLLMLPQLQHICSAVRYRRWACVTGLAQKPTATETGGRWQLPETVALAATVAPCVALHSVRLWLRLSNITGTPLQLLTRAWSELIAVHHVVCDHDTAIIAS